MQKMPWVLHAKADADMIDTDQSIENVFWYYLVSLISGERLGHGEIKHE
jgi:hypothetical protein